MSTLHIRQQGLSIIELLVALALSSVLILGITQIYIDNKRSYLFQQSQALNLDSARFADHILSDLLGKAGYQRSSHLQTLENFPAASRLTEHCESFAAGHAITKLKNGAQGLCLRYQPAVNNEVTCAGNALSLSDANRPAFKQPDDTEIAYIAIKFNPDDTNLESGTISCIDKEGPAELISGVADFHIEFGVGESGADRTLVVSPWKIPANWSDTQGPVRAVRYSVLLASARNQRDSADSAVFTHWTTKLATEARKTILTAQDNRRIYQIATGSQALRNLTP